MDAEYWDGDVGEVVPKYNELAPTGMQDSWTIRLSDVVMVCWIKRNDVDNTVTLNGEYRLIEKRTYGEAVGDIVDVIVAVLVDVGAIGYHVRR